MAKNYPLISGFRRKPRKEKDGSKGYGKPCVFCGKGTCGEKWVQVSYMRGEDETIRVCSEHWKKSNDEIVKKFIESISVNTKKQVVKCGCNGKPQPLGVVCAYSTVGMEICGAPVEHKCVHKGSIK